MPKNRSGYILVLTLIMLGVTTSLITKMFYQTNAYLPLAGLTYKQQQAKLLALGAIELAISQIAGKKKKSDAKEDETQQQKDVELLARILPILNHPQTFTLKDEPDGAIGKLSFSISCEDGKLNLNQFYDFQKHQFRITSSVSDPKVKGSVGEALYNLLEKLEKVTKGQVVATSAAPAISKFLQERAYPLFDVTELLQIPELAYFKNRVFQPINSTSVTEEGQTQTELYLTDLFTIYSSEMQPKAWFLSNSLVTILGFSRANPDDILKRKQAVGQGSKDNLSKWDQTFKDFYAVKASDIPARILGLFNLDAAPQTYGIVVTGEIGDVRQSAYVIVDRLTRDKDQQDFVIEKLYWI